MNRKLATAILGAALSIGATGQEFKQTLLWYASCKLRVIGTSTGPNTGVVQARKESGEALPPRNLTVSGGAVVDYGIGSFPGATQVVVSTTGPSVAAAVCLERIGVDRGRIQTGSYSLLGQGLGVATTPGLQNSTLIVTSDKPTQVKGMAEVQSVGPLQTLSGKSNDTNIEFSPSAYVHQRIQRGAVLSGLMPPAPDVINFHPHVFAPVSNWTSTVYVHNPHKFVTTAYTYPVGSGSTGKPLVRDIQPGQTITIPGAMLGRQAAEVLADRPVQSWTTYTWKPSDEHQPQEILIPANTRVNTGKKTVVPYADTLWSAIVVPNFETTGSVQNFV